MGKLIVFVIVLLIISSVGAAAVYFGYIPFPPKQPPTADATGSTDQGIKDVVSANNQFAFELYSELSKSEKGNLFYSPYSISAALAMTYEGASGKTADEMKSVFHFPESNILRPNFAAIYNELNQPNKDYELKTGNALWVQVDYPLLADYTSKVEKYYGGKAANLDFITQTEQSRLTINSFIEQQTNGKIKDLIPSGALNSLTRLVLTNAIYFKGTWEWEFDKYSTNEQDFKITPTNSVKAQMMHMNPEKAMFNYANTNGLEILELPYKGEKISMLILLPVANLDALQSSLTAKKLTEYKSQMQQTKLGGIYLPKFEFDTKYFMKDTLSSLGMPTAFSDQADFSGMDGRPDLYISSVIHQAYVKVDEKGTEAAAATAVIMMAKSAAPSKVFRADHPFIFIIQDTETGNILFMGRVTDPTK
jgi:serine protease inhibitor